jgi:hypothetical protein
MSRFAEVCGFAIARMTRPAGAGAKRQRMNKRLTGVLATATLFTLMFAPSAAAATTWTAQMGSHGSASLRVGSPDRLTISAKKFRASAPYVVTLRRGDCRSLGRLVLTVRVATTHAGTVLRSIALTNAQTRVATLPLAIRIGTTCASFAATAPTPTPTPTPTSTPTPTPTPTPSPSAGGTLVVVPFFMFAIPAGWTQLPSSDSGRFEFSGPGDRGIGAESDQTSLTLEEISAQVIVNIKSQTGAEPEQTEAITMDGAPGRLLTYHFLNQGVNVHELEAFCVHDGRVYEITFANVAGDEDADRTLVLNVIDSFGFLLAGF